MHSIDEVEFATKYSPAPLKETTDQSPQLSSTIDMNSTVNSKVNDEERKRKAAQSQALIDAWEKKKMNNLRPIGSQRETNGRTSVNVHECIDETEAPQELSGQSWDGREEYRVERESNGSQELNSEEDDGVISIVNEDVQEESEDEETDGMDEDITD
ncbi:hypothetical protein PRIPAC_95593 [Pristionchus pacificus]|uniref:Uncharacterized protein n=1 Tax=Pristionchus pacificus TaxID=54126 RepID=A0A454XY77_PRIPA|nr:hypothetical protein PRIPAC_95593 [Pristionchus pacificus]|eukprot:PDM63951.1 hypothetical protein PRIPAC_49452 [Pristionchus pacificus]